MKSISDSHKELVTPSNVCLIIDPQEWTNSGHLHIPSALWFHDFLVEVDESKIVSRPQVPNSLFVLLSRQVFKVQGLQIDQALWILKGGRSF